MPAVDVYAGDGRAVRGGAVPLVDRRRMRCSRQRSEWHLPLPHQLGVSAEAIQQRLEAAAGLLRALAERAGALAEQALAAAADLQAQVDALGGHPSHPEPRLTSHNTAPSSTAIFVAPPSGTNCEHVSFLLVGWGWSHQDHRFSVGAWCRLPA